MRKHFLLTFILCSFCFFVLSGCKCDHVWTEATCTESEICTECGETKGEPLGHNWTEATCVSQKNCSVCGAVEGEALGHDWIAADCDTAKTCDRCGETEGEALGHDWSDWTTETEPNDFDKGYEVRECERCGLDEGREIPALGHEHTLEKVDAVPATCTEGGSKEYYYCTNDRCGMWFEDATANVQITDKESIKTEALGHDYTEEIKDEAHLRSEADNCQEKDTYWYDCSRCAANAKDDAEASDKWFEAEAGDHKFDMENWGHKDAEGHAHKCELCDAVTGEAAHTPGPEATEYEPQICTECEYIIVPALGHKHVLSEVKGTSASCTESGTKTYYTCSGCNDWFEDAEGTKLIEDKESVIIPAAHTASGWKSDDEKHWKECLVEGCGEIMEEDFHFDGNKNGKCDTCNHKTGAGSAVPGTGDQSQVLLWTAMMLIGVCGILITAIYNKKRVSR